MKQTINKYQFVREFDEYNRSENFSVAGREALFDFLEEIEDPENEQELDIIALCCDFSEYANIKEFIKDYGFSDILRSDYEEDEEDTFLNVSPNTLDDVKQYLCDHTIFIDIDGESFIIQNF